MKLSMVLILMAVALSGCPNSVLAIYCPCNLRNWDPVCGTNGTTYVNRCEFECTQREYAKLGRRIYIAKKGRC
uniref:Protease inhibitor n=1 Tax=Stomoxys calcitrans TaxID=35570 RepID=A5WYF3_STOCA|nr:protease inhibitor [Stomoxys calcitrans]